MKSWISFLKTQLKHENAKLLGGIVLFHLLLFASIGTIKLAKPQQKQKLQVATKYAAVKPTATKTKPPTASTTPKKVQAAQKKPPPEKKPKPKPAPKVTKSKETKPVNKQKPAPSPTLDKHFETLASHLKQIRSSPTETIPTPVLAEKEIPNPSATNEEPSTSTDFSSKLTLFLKGALKLPGPGLVKVRLQITPSGEIVKVIPLDIQSPRNWDYLQSALQGLVTLEHGKANDEEIVITFCENTNSFE